MDAVAKINDPQCELLLIRACTGISKLYFAMRTCPPHVFVFAQRSLDMALRYALERISAALQTKLLRHVGIVASGSTFDDALCVFNTSMEIDFLSVPLFYVSKPCSACSKVFTGGTHEDHAVSCAGITGTKHRYNAVRDTLVDICFRLGISADKEVDIGLGGGCDKALRPADIMADFVPGRAVINVAQRKRGKYMAKCAAIGYGFLPFSFSSLGELEADAVTLLKRIQKFSMTQDIRARAAIHIFNRITFAIVTEYVEPR
ncbi:hypothetical protein Tco_0491381 [Tanacetum coccineum]